MVDPAVETTPVLSRLLLAAGLWVATGRRFDDLIPQNFDPGADGNRLIELAIREKMIPMLDSFSRATALDLGEVPSRLTSVFAEVSALHYRQLEGIIQNLRTQEIEIALLKGGDLDLSIYGAALPRSMSDLDILVRPVEVAAVEAALAAAGFQQGIFDRKSLTIRTISEEVKHEAEAGKAELVEYGKAVRLRDIASFRTEILRYFGPESHHRMVALDRDVYVFVALDVHVNLAEGFEVEDAWHQMREITLPGGTPTLGQALTDLVWFLAVRLYHETLLDNRPTLRAFVDIAAVLEKFAAEIDWSYLLFIAKKYKLQPSLYFVLWHVNEVLGDVVPAATLKELDPLGSTSDRSHDWGDFVPKMLGELSVHPLRP